MKEPRLGTDRLVERFQKGNHVVLDDLLDVGDAVDLDAGFFPNACRRPFGRLPRQVERFAVKLIAPVLHKLGLGIAPEHVFIALLVLLGLLVLRDFYRQMVELLTRRRARLQ